MLVACHVICIHVLGMDHEASVLVDDAIVVLLRDQFMPLCDFVLRNENIANVRWPEVFWRLALATEASL